MPCSKRSTQLKTGHYNACIYHVLVFTSTHSHTIDFHLEQLISVHVSLLKITSMIIQIVYAFH